MCIIPVVAKRASSLKLDFNENNMDWVNDPVHISYCKNNFLSFFGRFMNILT